MSKSPRPAPSGGAKRTPAGWAASGYKGVYAYRGGWRATVRIDGRPVHVGVFPTPEAAHAAYQERVRQCSRPVSERSGEPGGR